MVVFLHHIKNMISHFHGCVQNLHFERGTRTLISSTTFVLLVLVIVFLPPLWLNIIYAYSNKDIFFQNNSIIICKMLVKLKRGEFYNLCRTVGVH